MSDCLLKGSIFERALKGEAGEEELRLLSEHLRSPCPDCEGTVLGLSGEEEDLAARFLFGAVPAFDPITEREKDSLFHSVAAFHPDTKVAAPPPAAGRSFKQNRGRFMALAAMVFLVICLPLLVLYLDQPTEEGIKQGAAPDKGGVFLQFLVQDKSGHQAGTSSFKRGENNGRYSEASSLLFRFQLGSPAWLYLVRAGQDGRGETIFPVIDKGPIAPPGFYDAASDDGLLMYPLSGLTGPQTFCAVAYPASVKRPGPGAAAKRILKELDEHRQNPGYKRLQNDWIDCFQIEVLKQ